MWDYWEEHKHVIPADDAPYSKTSEYESDDSEDQKKSMVTRSMGMIKKKIIPIDEVAHFTQRFV